MSSMNSTMPNSIEAEKAVIGSMIMDAEAIDIAGEMLTAEDFYSRVNGIFYTTIQEMRSHNIAVDPVTLQTRLRDQKLPDEVCSDEAMADLLTALPTSVNIRSYAAIVADKAKRRNLIRINEEAAAACYDQSTDTAAILDKEEKLLFEFSQKRTASDFISIRDIVLQTVAMVENASNTESNITGLSSGFGELDSMTAGLQPSDLILVGARPSMGKTAFALDLAKHAVLVDKRCVAIFSLEMDKKQLVSRLFAMSAKVDAQKIRTGNLNEKEWNDLIDSAGDIGESRLIIDDTPAISVPELRSKCRKYKMEYGLEMVIIDYLQLMSGSGGRSNESRQQEISEISRALKALARELNVPVIALSQLSRAVESRPDHRPILSDLRESGAIEQDADLVMFLYRDEYYNKNTDTPGIAEVIIAKQRNGPIGKVNLQWEASLTSFLPITGDSKDRTSSRSLTLFDE